MSAGEGAVRRDHTGQAHSRSRRGDMFQEVVAAVGRGRDVGSGQILQSVKDELVSLAMLR